MSDQGWFTAQATVGNGACVEVRQAGVLIAVRDSKNRGGSSLYFDRADLAVAGG